MQASAIALRRISSKDQAEGHSLEAQATSTSNMAKQLGVPIVKTWDEVQTSKKGKNFGRKDMEEILLFCKQHPDVKFLLIDFVNRLMREVDIMIYYKVLLDQLGVTIVFCDPAQHHLNSGDQYSQLMLLIEGYKAEQDNAARSETTIARMKARYAEGYYISHPHQGYMKSDIAGMHIPDPLRFEPLQAACKHIIYDGYTVNEGVKWLNDSGYRTAGGRKMTIDHFVSLLSDRYYCGFIDIKSEGWPKNVRGVHEPMLTVQEHSKLRAIMTKRNPRIRAKHNPDFPMANILRHEECVGKGGYEKFAGVNFNRGKRNGKQRPLLPVYDCRDCRKRIPRNKLHENFSNHLARLSMIPSKEVFTEALIKVWRSQRGSVAERVKVLNAKKSRLESKIKDTAATYATEPESRVKESLRQLLTEYSKEIEAVDQEILASQSLELESEDFVRFALDFVETLPINWWSLGYEDRKRGEQILFNGKIHADSSAIVRTPQISSIYRLGANKKDLGKVSLSSMVELPVTATGSAGLFS